MIKGYCHDGEQCMLVDNNDEISYVPYNDNMGEFLALQNQVEYLTKELDDDQKKIGSLLYKDYTGKEKFITNEVLATGVAVVAGAACFFTTNNVPYTLGTGAFCGGFITLFSSVSYLDSYSPKKINAYRECIKYEKSLLDSKSKTLSEISKDDSNNYEENENNRADILAVDDSELEFIKECIKLRYYYGYNKKRIIGMYKKGILFEVLKSLEYSDEAISEFLVYIEREIKNIKRNKENKKELNKAKRKALIRRISDCLDD